MIPARAIMQGELVGLAVTPRAVAFATSERRWAVLTDDPAGPVGELEAAVRPRWVWWDSGTPKGLLAAGLRVATCWDVAAVHRLIFGGWKAAPDRAWAALQGLPLGGLPAMGQLNLLDAAGDGVTGEDGDPENPVQLVGYLNPEWVTGGWAGTPERAAAWAATALTAAGLQAPQVPRSTAWSESAAELLCAELEHDGLPIDRTRALELIAAAVGPRPRDAAHAREIRAARDRVVLDLVRADNVDLRNPAQVKAMLAGIGFDLPDTRSWRLEPHRGSHPVIEPLLAWRKAERIATTYGYGWLAANVGPDDRLRGAWSGSDGAAGRMTAQAGLHNLPAELRPAVAAEEGHVFVRADLGQVEPRVLAVVSGDPEFARAAREDDLYAPVAKRLKVGRPIAKVAVLAAMYGQTSGTAGEALKGLQAAYPVAMAYLDAAYESGRSGRGVRTFGGRQVTISAPPGDLDEHAFRAAQNARGRYARNAVVQGAAAELFKMWAVTVRSRLARLDARIVLCLHDELLIHCPEERAAEVVTVVLSCLESTSRNWQRGATAVRFVADVATVRRWSEAK